MTFRRHAARYILRLAGWKLLDLPQRPAKAVVIVYPHTSNWDFVIGVVALAALPIDACWLGKHTLFNGILGPLMSKLGGIPVDRRERSGLVDQMAGEFRRRSRFLLAIATEGTRGLRPGWKSGFYRIALAADVPVLIGAIDYANREIGLVASLRLCGDEAADMARIAACYEGRRGYRHENASPIRLL